MKVWHLFTVHDMHRSFLGTFSSPEKAQEFAYTYHDYTFAIEGTVDTPLEYGYGQKEVSLKPNPDLIY
jgi:hypothetical protein